MGENPYESPKDVTPWLGGGLGCGWLVPLFVLVPTLIYGAFVALARTCSVPNSN